MIKTNTEAVEAAIDLVRRTVKAAQTFRVAAQAATFGDEVRPTKELVDAVNQLFASLPSPQAVSQLEWAALSPTAKTKPSAAGLVEADVSIAARAIRQTMRDYGHNSADTTLPEIIAGSVCKALSAPTREREWQPIETAPRDGTRILTVVCGFQPMTTEPFEVAIARWAECEGKAGWLSVDPEDYECVGDSEQKRIVAIRDAIRTLTTEQTNG